MSRYKQKILCRAFSHTAILIDLEYWESQTKFSIIFDWSGESNPFLEKIFLMLYPFLLASYFNYRTYVNQSQLEKPDEPKRLMMNLSVGQGIF